MLPDMLSALVGFDRLLLLPAGYEGFGARIGAGIGLLRLVLPPMLKRMREAGRAAGPGPSEGPR